jgi:hypothetical protein
MPVGLAADLTLDNLRGEILSVRAMVALGVEDRDTGSSTRLLHPHHSVNETGLLDCGSTLGFLRVQIDVERVEEEHPGPTGDDWVFGHFAISPRWLLTWCGAHELRHHSRVQAQQVDGVSPENALLALG